jgi:sugar O-acyltransferase (sialic acid O-acetyltransferase NeuD family)
MTDPEGALPVQIPLLNPNEPEALLAGLHVNPGQWVSAGDLLCTLETTKSSADLHAEASGYVVYLQNAQGDTVSAGNILCYLSSSIDWRPPDNMHKSIQDKVERVDEAVPEGLRITRPALALARGNQIDLHALPIGPLVTEKLIQGLIDHPMPQTGYETEIAIDKTEHDSTSILVYGGGGHGKMVIDLLRALQTYRISSLIDDGIEAGKLVMGIPVAGGAEALARLYDHGVRLAANAVGGIGNIQARISVFDKLRRAGFAFPILIHPIAHIEPGAELDSGAQVFTHAYVGSEARVGFGTIINTGAIISHDCILGDYVNISPGAILAGEVRVGDMALVGMGATVNLGVNIGRGARIGNGATVKSDVPEGGVVKAGSLWPKD